MAAGDSAEAVGVIPTFLFLTNSLGHNSKWDLVVVVVAVAADPWAREVRYSSSSSSSSSNSSKVWTQWQLFSIVALMLKKWFNGPQYKIAKTGSFVVDGLYDVVVLL